MKFSILVTSLFFATWLFGCSSEPVSDNSFGLASDSPGAKAPPENLTPVGKLYDTTAAPIIHSIVPRGAAEKAGLRVGDLILNINNKMITTANDFDMQSKLSPRESTIQVRRGLLVKTFNINLANSRPRVGVNLEPMDTPIIRQGTPLISSIHKKDMTVHAEASVTGGKRELHVNFIVESSKFEPAALAKMTVLEELDKKMLLKSQENINALGTKPYLITRKFLIGSDVKLPIRVSLNLSNNNFVFEFK